MSFRSVVLLCLQFLSMGYLINKFSMSHNWFIIAIQLLGIGVALWGIVAGGIHRFNMQPEVKSDVLITNGPFALIRNPMYLGVLLFFGMIIIHKWSTINVIVYLILIMALILKIYSEEHFLESKFGEQYRTYKSKTFRLIPYVY